MWIFTPDLAYNTDRFKSIWADGHEPLLHLDPGDGMGDEFIAFDSVESSIAAFDAVMNGIASSRKTLLLREERHNGKLRLVVEYDKSDYVTHTVNSQECIIKDPRTWTGQIMVPALPSQIKS